MESDSENTPIAGVEQAEEKGRSGRRRKSRRRRGVRRSHDESSQNPSAPTVPMEGFIYRREDGKVFLLAPDRHFEPGTQDPIVDPALASRFTWESGLRVQAAGARGTEPEPRTPADPRQHLNAD